MQLDNVQDIINTPEDQKFVSQKGITLKDAYQLTSWYPTKNHNKYLADANPPAQNHKGYLLADKYITYNQTPEYFKRKISTYKAASKSHNRSYLNLNISSNQKKIISSKHSPLKNSKMSHLKQFFMTNSRNELQGYSMEQDETAATTQKKMTSNDSNVTQDLHKSKSSTLDLKKNDCELEPIHQCSNMPIRSNSLLNKHVSLMFENQTNQSQKTEKNRRSLQVCPMIKNSKEPQENFPVNKRPTERSYVEAFDLTDIAKPQRVSKNVSVPRKKLYINDGNKINKSLDNRQILQINTSTAPLRQMPRHAMSMSLPQPTKTTQEALMHKKSTQHRMFGTVRNSNAELPKNSRQNAAVNANIAKLKGADRRSNVSMISDCSARTEVHNIYPESDFQPILDLKGQPKPDEDRNHFKKKSKNEDLETPTKLIDKLQLYELFDNQVFVKNLLQVKTIEQKLSFIDKMVNIREKNIRFKQKNSVNKIEQLLRKFIGNLKQAVSKRRQEKHQIANYFLFNELTQKTFDKRRSLKMAAIGGLTKPGKINGEDEANNSSLIPSVYFKDDDLKKKLQDYKPIQQSKQQSSIEAGSLVDESLFQGNGGETPRKVIKSVDEIYDDFEKSYPDIKKKHNNSEKQDNMDYSYMNDDIDKRLETIEEDDDLCISGDKSIGQIPSSKDLGNINDKDNNTEEVLAPTDKVFKKEHRFSSPDINSSGLITNKNNIKILHEKKESEKNDLLEIVGKFTNSISKPNRSSPNSWSKQQRLTKDMDIVSNLKDFSENLRKSEINQPNSLKSTQTKERKRSVVSRSSILIQNKKADLHKYQEILNSKNKEVINSIKNHCIRTNKNQIRGIIIEFLLEYPEARNIFLGDNDGKKQIDSPRLLKKKMQTYILKRTKQKDVIGSSLRKAFATKEYKKQIDIQKKTKLRKEKQDPAHQGYNFLDEDFDVFDQIQAKENLTYDLISFIFKTNSDFIIDNFMSLDKIPGYTSHLLTHFEELYKMAYISAVKEKKLEKVPKKNYMEPFENINRKAHILTKSSVALEDITDGGKPVKPVRNGRIIYFPHNMVKFKRIYSRFADSQSCIKALARADTNIDKNKEHVSNLEDRELKIQEDLRFDKEINEHLLYNGDRIKSEGSMGDVDELKYDALYTKSIVLRKKMDMLRVLSISENGRAICVLNKLAEELTELSDQISLTFCKFLRLSNK